MVQIKQVQVKQAKGELPQISFLDYQYILDFQIQTDLLKSNIQYYLKYYSFYTEV